MGESVCAERPGSRADVRPIGDYAIIGDCRTAGLVSKDGSLDWLCLPRFDGPSVFGALLDAEIGGRFRIRPVGEFESERRYLPNTNVLETTYRTPEGVCTLRDLMPVASEAEKRVSPLPDHLVLRELEGLAGEVTIEVLYEPRPDYARRSPRIECRGALGLWCELGDGASCVLRSEVPLELADGWPLRAWAPPATGRRARLPGVRRQPGRPRAAAAARSGGAQPDRAIRPLVAGLGGSLHLPRAVPRGGGAERPDAEADGLCAVRGGRRGADDLAAGADRRDP